MIYLNNLPVTQDHFPDNTLLVKMIADCIPSDIYCISWFYENDAELFTLICLKGWLDDHDPHAAVELLMPYLPHARMDRVKKETDVFTLKYFCNTINSLAFSEVTIIDPHSNVAPALLDRVNVCMPTHSVKKAIKASGAEVLFFPDEGAAKRYSGKFNMPTTFGVKDREWGTGRINSLILMNPEMVAGKRVLIIDDICSYGGTFAHAGKALREAGAVSVDLYVTHCEPNIFKGGIYTEHPSPIDHIYTTDTLLEKPIEVAGRMTFVSKYRPEVEVEDND